MSPAVATSLVTVAICGTVCGLAVIGPRDRRTRRVLAVVLVTIVRSAWLGYAGVMWVLR